jgi:hypothetical protein
MYCPSCGKETPENSKFCLHCGQSITSHTATVAQPIQWESKDFEHEFPPTGKCAWVALTGQNARTESDARLFFWEEYHRELTTNLQQWYDEGWQPIGEVGPPCFRIRTVRDSRDTNPLYWIVVLVLAIPTLGLSLLYAIVSQTTFAEPTLFVVPMRRPEVLRS